MQPPSSSDVGDNLLKLRRALAERVELVAVSKYHPVRSIVEAYEAGQRLFGESRVQELVAKEEELRLVCPDIRWHFIGHLQTNKVKYIAPFVEMIESVDSLRLLDEINKQALRCGRTIPVLLEVRIAQEDTKHGLEREELLELLEEVRTYPEEYRGVELRGLMTMASLTEDEVQVEAEFIEVRHLFDHIRNAGLVIDPDRFTELSMGMSGDYPIAIRAGATLIRVGSSIFGERAG